MHACRLRSDRCVRPRGRAALGGAGLGHRRATTASSGPPRADTVRGRAGNDRLIGRAGRRPPGRRAPDATSSRQGPAQIASSPSTTARGTPCAAGPAPTSSTPTCRRVAGDCELVGQAALARPVHRPREPARDRGRARQPHRRPDDRRDVPGRAPVRRRGHERRLRDLDRRRPDVAERPPPRPDHGEPARGPARSARPTPSSPTTPPTALAHLDARDRGADDAADDQPLVRRASPGAPRPSRPRRPRRPASPSTRTGSPATTAPRAPSAAGATSRTPTASGTTGIAVVILRATAEHLDGTGRDPGHERGRRLPGRQADGRARRRLPPGNGRRRRLRLGRRGRRPSTRRRRCRDLQARNASRPALLPAPRRRTSTRAADASGSPGTTAASARAAAENSVVVSTSADGRTWTAPGRVTSGRNAFLPAIGIHPVPGGRPSPTTCSARAEASTSSSSRLGRTAAGGPPRRLSAQTMRPDWLPDTVSGRMLADYISVHYAGSRPLVVWVLASEPVGASLRQAIYATRAP